MEVIAGLFVIMVVFAFPLIGGLMAISFGRKFWPWFWLSIPFPLLSCIILLCLPRKDNSLQEKNDALKNYFNNPS